MAGNGADDFAGGWEATGAGTRDCDTCFFAAGWHAPAVTAAIKIRIWPVFKIRS
jgi:hypothetical protein